MTDEKNDINIAEEIKGVKISTTALALISWLLILLERIITKDLVSFGFLFESVIIVVFFLSYLKSMRKTNFTFWAFSFLLFIFFLRFFIGFTFYHYDQYAFVLAMLGFSFWGLNCYILSSPLYYSRVQWWEYDYKYRADLKIEIEVGESFYKGRLTDFRRTEASIELFEYVDAETKALLHVKIKGEKITVPVKFKTHKEVIRGRPNRYGIILKKDNSDFSRLKTFWSLNKRAKLRNRFAENA